MKKRFTFLLSALALLTFLIAPNGVWGQNTATQTSFNNNFGNVNNDSKVTFRCYKGGGTSIPYTTNNTIRLYQISGNNYVGSYVVIGVAEGYKITSATIQSTSATTTGYKLTDENPNTSTQPSNTTIITDFNVNNYSLSANVDYTISNISTQYITFGCFGTTSGTRLHLSKISIIYESTSGASTFNVTYNANDGSTIPSTFVDNNGGDGYESGANVTVLANDVNNNENPSFAKTGHTFNNWNTIADGTGTEYDPEDSNHNSFQITANTTLYARWTVNTHTVTLPEENEFGTYTMNPTNPVDYNAEVTLTYTPKAGYENYVATWSSEQVTITGNKFTMPDSDVTVTVNVAEYVQPTEIEANLNDAFFGTSYGGSAAGITDDNPVSGTKDNVTITYAGGGNHYINASQIRFYPNNKLTFEVPSGYEIKQIVFTADGTWTATISANLGTYTSNTKTWTGSASTVVFTGSGSGRCDMSKATITIGSEAPKYSITYDTGLTNGAFADGNPTSAAENESVTVTTVPEDGYRLASMTYYDGNDHAATVSGNEGTFTMPGLAVTVSATFELIPEVVAEFVDGIYTESLNTENSFNNMTTVNVLGDQEWTFNSSYNCAYINGWANSQNNDNTDWLITPKLAVANGKLDIAFQTYHNSFGSGQLSVKWSATKDVNSNTWTSLGFTEGEDGKWVDSEFTITTNDSYIYVAFVYEATTQNSPSTGSWEVKNFTAKQYYTITNGNPANGSITIVPDDKQVVGGDVLVEATPASGYHFTSWSITPTVTVENDAFTMPAQNVTVSAVFEQDVTYTVTYSENGETISDQITSGPIGNNLPTTPFCSVPANLTFVGWSTSEIAKYTESTPTLENANYNVTGDVTFYAVYKYDYSYSTGSGTPTWTKVTDASTLAAGDQLVIASDAQGKVAADISSQYMAETTATFENDIITDLADNAVILTLDGNSSAWTLTHSTNGSLGATALKKLAWGTGTTTWTISISDGNATIQSTESSYGRFLHNVSNIRFTTYTSDPQSNMLLPQLYRLEGGSQIVNGSYYLTSVTTLNSNTQIDGTQSLNNNVTIDSEGSYSYTINGTLNANGYLIVNPTASKIVVNNGGQLIHSNVLKATLQKSIEAYTEIGDSENKSDGWYTIASPVSGNYEATATNGIANGKYDLYLYNEPTHYWYNAEGDNPFTTLSNGKGYLYANEADQTLSFTGNMLGTSTEDVIVYLTYTYGAGSLAGYNLVGNPFTCELTGNIKIGDAPLSSYSYVANGTDLTTVNISDRPIKPGEGFFVQTSAAGNLVFNPSGKGNTSSKPAYLSIEAGDENFMDRAYVQIANGNTLTKMTLNDEVAHVSVVNEGTEYAAATIEAAQGQIPVNFKAAKEGTYTISVKAQNLDVDYLHLIDNLTGNDVDLLQNPSYTFNGKKSDYASRFRLVFNANEVDNEVEMDNEFAFLSNGNIVIVNQGEATLRVVDMLGRTLSTQTLNGNANVNTMTPGVYVLQLINGNDVKTQKIVIR